MRTLDDSIKEFIGDSKENQERFKRAKDKTVVSSMVYLMRTELALTLEEFGNILGVSPEDVDNIEEGDFRDEPWGLLEAIAYSLKAHRLKSATNSE